MTIPNSKKLVYMALLIAIVLASLPAPALAAEADIVRFRVENRDPAVITLRLYSQDGSGQAYYMTVEGESSKVMTPLAGVYDFRLTSCGVVVRGEIDLSRHHTWVLPSCGTKGGPGTKAPATTDASEIVRLVKVDLVNESSTRIMLVLGGTYQYVFVIEGKATKTVTILKGDYGYTLFCFTEIHEGSFLARANKVQEFDCN